jgi:hypothetical protein
VLSVGDRNENAKLLQGHVDLAGKK